jgi:hypothetical protein
MHRRRRRQGCRRWLWVKLGVPGPCVRWRGRQQWGYAVAAATTTAAARWGAPCWLGDVQRGGGDLVHAFHVASVEGERLQHRQRCRDEAAREPGSVSPTQNQLDKGWLRVQVRNGYFQGAPSSEVDLKGCGSIYVRAHQVVCSSGRVLGPLLRREGPLLFKTRPAGMQAEGGIHYRASAEPPSRLAGGRHSLSSRC